MTPAKPGRPRAGTMLRDGLKATFANPVASMTAAFIVALSCFVVLMTSGRTAATEAGVLASLDDAGTRLITVTDTSGRAGLHPESVEALRRLPGVAWVVGFGPAVDAVMEAPGSLTGQVPLGVPVRSLVGPLPEDCPVVSGRLALQPGEAVAPRQAAASLGLLDGAGPVATPERQTGVVGIVDLTGALARFADTVLVTASPEDAGPLRYLYLVADDAADVPTLAAAVAAAVWADEPSQMIVETSEAILALQRVISGQLGASSRQLMAAIMGVGVAVVAATMFAVVGSKRRDFGRRRALGASRSAIVALVLIQAGLTAVAGALVGCGIGLVTIGLTSGVLPTIRFSTGFVVLAILAATAGAVPPAVVAARRDPVRKLRVP